ncbi:homocysteine S-methyltransferase family protein [Adlercreutzia murintestinalis]|uniref:homocysteine S-methyltransferase family protein n=1 Tax=Adlercreutzia murintestinalis TaxID=2941325 RepID=UPI00203F1A6F|nr:homocysteine S-methyltransferase family protein [Adlercreutzia murintestinalis]
MADIQLRFLKDMLVLSEPVWTELARLGLNVQRDGELTLLLEPEVFEEAYKLDMLVGAQCLVTPTASLAPMRLAQVRMEQRAEELAKTALRVVRMQNPQHVLVELGPCGLPLDPSSRASLNENSDQYKRAARLFDGEDFDAFFLNGFTRAVDLKCALIGLRKVSDAPVLASVQVDAADMLPSGDTLRDAVGVMAEYGAQVLGLSTAAPLDAAVRMTQSIRAEYALPILVQLEVRKRNLEEEVSAPSAADFDNEADSGNEVRGAMAAGPYAEPDDMVDVADALRAAGAQFLRATGDATPAYTGALVAATDDLDVVLPPELAARHESGEPEALDDVAARLRAKISRALEH